MGTPKTLIEAIQNGLDEAGQDSAKSIERHVRDLLAQKLSVAFLQSKTADEERLIQDLCVRLGVRRTSHD